MPVQLSRCPGGALGAPEHLGHLPLVPDSDTPPVAPAVATVALEPQAGVASVLCSSSSSTERQDECVNVCVMQKRERERERQDELGQGVGFVALGWTTPPCSCSCSQWLVLSPLPQMQSMTWPSSSSSSSWRLPPLSWELGSTAPQPPLEISRSSAESPPSPPNTKSGSTRCRRCRPLRERPPAAPAAAAPAAGLGDEAAAAAAAAAPAAGSGDEAAAAAAAAAPAAAALAANPGQQRRKSLPSEWPWCEQRVRRERIRRGGPRERSLGVGESKGKGVWTGCVRPSARSVDGEH